MKPVSTITSPGVPLLIDNIDTDTIIPSREMRSTGRTGLADGLFAPWRYSDADKRIADPAFVLNQRDAIGTRLLLGGSNFGCGSSREHAVWALAEFGIEAIIAPSFAPIFKNNCIRNGLLPVELPEEVVRELQWAMVTIDLANQTVSASGKTWRFAIDDEAKAMLLEGLDAIDLTLKHREAIAGWTASDREARPWVYLCPPQAPLGEGDRPQDGGGVATHLPPRTNAAVTRARQLRRSMSKPEAALWQELRKRPGGFKFRRQHPAGPYTLDFYCAAARLCIEIDGSSHDFGDRPQRDAGRDLFLQQNKVATLRIAARDVLTNIGGVLNQITNSVAERVPLHRPADGPPPQPAAREDR